jgi:hypothetical protein
LVATSIAKKVQAGGLAEAHDGCARTAPVPSHSINNKTQRLSNFISGTHNALRTSIAPAALKIKEVFLPCWSWAGSCWQINDNIST